MKGGEENSLSNIKREMDKAEKKERGNRSRCSGRVSLQTPFIMLHFIFKNLPRHKRIFIHGEQRSNPILHQSLLSCHLRRGDA